MSKNNSFKKNVLIIMIGLTIAQAIPVIISPILTRLYSPEDFGAFALYMAAASIMVVAVTGKYEVAIVLPKKDSDAVNLLALSIIISFFVSLISLVIIFVFNTKIISLLGNTKISHWLYVLPITILFAGIYQSFNYWLNRKKEYKRIATSAIVQSTTTATANLGMGFGHVGSDGLILGGVFGQGVTIAVLAKMILGVDKNKIKYIRKRKIISMVKKYSKQPKYVLPTSLLDMVSMKIPIFAISSLYHSLIMVGYYMLVERMLSIPMGIIGGAIGQNFYQEFSNRINNNNKKSAKILLLKVWMFLFAIGIFPTILLFIYGPELFSFLFGESWKEAGDIASILAWMYLFIFISSPTSRAYLVLGLQNIGLYFGIISLVYRGFIFYISDNIMQALYLFVLAEIVQIICYNLILWRKL
ncbi:lipopolysaccharide biosynthesis protein [Pseudofrancisella aestuarii]|uniref:Lipopolysaccharide biosynthesis protein n=1 Tax=Pseudofrancisella aestuarii TaxID=2670347 RepID=A0ABV9T9S4_9GAMM|nr:oligosaccharide flippase family protein [Pseudofrancisella aestuarii]